MGTINFITQNVDGIGKTFIANKLGEYFEGGFQNFPLFNTENAIDLSVVKENGPSWFWE